MNTAVQTAGGPAASSPASIVGPHPSCRSSSAVEQSPCKRQVAGSNPCLWHQFSHFPPGNDRAAAWKADTHPVLALPGQFDTSTEAVGTCREGLKSERQGTHASRSSARPARSENSSGTRHGESPGRSTSLTERNGGMYWSTPRAAGTYLRDGIGGKPVCQKSGNGADNTPVVAGGPVTCGAGCNRVSGAVPQVGFASQADGGKDRAFVELPSNLAGMGIGLSRHFFCGV